MRNSRVFRLLLGTAVLGLSLSARAADPSWPQWRGPDGQGHAPAAAGLPLQWSESTNVLWKSPVQGRGWSSPVLEKGRIWVTTALETEADPAVTEKRLKETTGGQPLTVLAHLSLRAVCFDFETGRQLHDVEVFSLEEPQSVHQLNSYASPTPFLREGRLYCHFGTFGTACLDAASGEVLWRNRQLQIMHENGPGSSPVLWNDLLIVHYDGSDQQFLAAYDAGDGGVRWKTGRSGELPDNPQLKKAYGTPLVLPWGNREVLISPAADWLYAYDPASGEELWKLNYGVQGFSNVPRPVAGHGMIYLSTGFMRPELIAVRPGAAGQPEIVWRSKRNVPQTPSPILVGNEIYYVSDSGGIVTCLDALTGEEIWKERIAAGNYSASPLFADGKLFFHAQQGVTTVLKPGREFAVLAENTLEGRLFASAAAVGSSLLLRTDQALYRLAGRP